MISLVFNFYLESFRYGSYFKGFYAILKGFHFRFSKKFQAFNEWKCCVSVDVVGGLEVLIAIVIHLLSGNVNCFPVKKLSVILTDSDNYYSHNKYSYKKSVSFFISLRHLFHWSIDTSYDEEVKVIQYSCILKICGSSFLHYRSYLRLSFGSWEHNWMVVS